MNVLAEKNEALRDQVDALTARLRSKTSPTTIAVMSTTSTTHSDAWLRRTYQAMTRKRKRGDVNTAVHLSTEDLSTRLRHALVGTHERGVRVVEFLLEHIRTNNRSRHSRYVTQFARDVAEDILLGRGDDVRASSAAFFTLCKTMAKRDPRIWIRRAMNLLLDCRKSGSLSPKIISEIDQIAKLCFPDVARQSGLLLSASEDAELVGQALNAELSSVRVFDRTLEALCTRCIKNGWLWTFNNVIRLHLWPVLMRVALDDEEDNEERHSWHVSIRAVHLVGELSRAALSRDTKATSAGITIIRRKLESLMGLATRDMTKTVRIHTAKNGTERSSCRRLRKDFFVRTAETLKILGNGIPSMWPSRSVTNWYVSLSREERIRVPFAVPVTNDSTAATLVS